MSSSFETNGKATEVAPKSGGTEHFYKPKYDSTRQISPSLVHELNNMLTVIQGYAEQLLHKNGENPALGVHLRIICEATRRAAVLIHTVQPPATVASTAPKSTPEPSLSNT